MRVEVSKEELLELLNERLQEREDTESCSFVGPIICLKGFDQEGCNWSRQVHLRCSGRDATDYLASVACEVIDEIAGTQNLTPE